MTPTGLHKAPSSWAIRRTQADGSPFLFGATRGRLEHLSLQLGRAMLESPARYIGRASTTATPSANEERSNAKRIAMGRLAEGGGRPIAKQSNQIAPCHDHSEAVVQRLDSVIEANRILDG